MGTVTGTRFENQLAKDTLVKILITCGPTMQAIARIVQESDSNDLREILGDELVNQAPISEIVETCQKTSSGITVQGLVRHFASFEHFNKMSNLRESIASQFPRKKRGVIHTLLPVRMVDGKCVYECGGAHVEFHGLIQIGEPEGVPWVHLAGLIWLPDDGMHERVLREQAENGVASAAKRFPQVSYYDAILRTVTTRGKKMVFGGEVA